MVKQYGGVNNKKSIDEIQEAVIVAAPIFRKKQPKSKAGVIGGWLVYWVVSWPMALLVIDATGIGEQMISHHVPWWVHTFIITSVPFLLTLAWSVFKSEKVRKQKDAGD